LREEEYKCILVKIDVIVWLSAFFTALLTRKGYLLLKIALKMNMFIVRKSIFGG
jgi:hypothetical protein